MPFSDMDFQDIPPKQFVAMFNKMDAANAKVRRFAKRTLTPAILKSKDPVAMARLGMRDDGKPFTREDLLGFEKQIKTLKSKFSSNERGITYAQIVAGSLPIDIARSNNSVSDGSGVNAASMVGVEKNVFVAQVASSDASTGGRYRVRVRFETWFDAMNISDGTMKGYEKAVEHTVKDRVSFDCNCGRHQYWFRYLATVGNFALSPKEFSFPKIRNPTGQGVACKHVLLVLNRLKSISWQRSIALRLAKAAEAIGYGDDSKKQKFYFDEDEIKKANSLSRRGSLDPAKEKAAFARYLKSRQRLANRLVKDQDKIKKLQGQLKRSRAQTVKAKQGNADKLMLNKMQGFIEALEGYGVTKTQAIDQFAIKQKLSKANLKRLKGKLK